MGVVFVVGGRWEKARRRGRRRRRPTYNMMMLMMNAWMLKCCFAWCFCGKAGLIEGTDEVVVAWLCVLCGWFMWVWC